MENTFKFFPSDDEIKRKGKKSFSFGVSSDSEQPAAQQAQRQLSWWVREDCLWSRWSLANGRAGRGFRVVDSHPNEPRPCLVGGWKSFDEKKTML